MIVSVNRSTNQMVSTNQPVCGRHGKQKEEIAEVILNVVLIIYTEL